jgi:thiol-disulfide isomerase/thioredoxin
MRTALIVFCALAIWAGVAVSQKSEWATIAPQKPRVGETITLTYDASHRGALLKNSEDMIAEVMVVGEDEDATVLEPLMKRSGALWTGTFALKQAKAQILFYRFRSGNLLDDNGENTWRVLVYGKDGRPVRGAHIASATAHQYPNLRGFKTQKNTEAASADLDRELALYPDNWRAPLTRWQFMGRSATSDEGKTMIAKELDGLVAAHMDDEKALADLLAWYERIGQKEKADAIRAPILKKHPKGKVAEAAMQSLIYQERDASKRADLIERFLKEFPQEGSTLENLQMQQFAFLIRANEFGKADSLAASMERPSGQLYNSLAWPFIEKGENLEQAVAWAKKGVDLLGVDDPAAKPPSVTTADWKQNTRFARGMVLDTYGFGLMKLGKLSDAERAFDEALELTEYQDPEINERATECLVKAQRYEKAITVSLASIAKGKTNEGLMNNHAAAYRAVHGSEAGLQESIQAAKAAAAAVLSEKLSTERINKPAVDFTLKSIDGSVVKLSALRGKIVVIDFWATWCGPCLQSFPYLQKVYDRHKNDADIVILAVNTWESKTGKDLEDHVKDFMVKNKYSFPVLFDQGFVDKYGVEGIPTKFIIDQKGMIQFKDIGFGGGEEMMQKMEMQFDLLRRAAK